MAVIYHRPALWGLMLIVGMQSLPADELEQRRREAAHPATGVTRLQELARDADWEVRQRVSRNRRTPTDLLHQLAGDAHPQVRIGVATNLETEARTFLKLARDPDPSVRSVVARFEYVPAEALSILAGDADGAIRYEVARNWNTSPATLRKLRDDPLPEVSHMAQLSLAKRREEADE